MYQPTYRISPDYPGFGGGSPKRKRTTKRTKKVSIRCRGGRTKKPATKARPEVEPSYEPAKPLRVPVVVALPPFLLLKDPAQLLSREDIQAITRSSKSAFFRHTRLPGFPAPICFGARTVRYRRSEFEAWLESLKKPLDSRN